MTDGGPAAAISAAASGARSQIRRGPAGGYRRGAWISADLTCREWSADVATRLGLTVEVGRHANLWTGWRPPGTTGDAAGILAGVAASATVLAEPSLGATPNAPVHHGGVPGPPTTAGHATPLDGEDLGPAAAEDLVLAVGDATR